MNPQDTFDYSDEEGFFLGFSPETKAEASKVAELREKFDQDMGVMEAKLAQGDENHQLLLLMAQMRKLQLAEVGFLQQVAVQVHKGVSRNAQAIKALVDALSSDG